MQASLIVQLSMVAGWLLSRTPRRRPRMDDDTDVVIRLEDVFAGIDCLFVDLNGDRRVRALAVGRPVEGQTAIRDVDAEGVQCILEGDIPSVDVPAWIVDALEVERGVLLGVFKFRTGEINRPILDR